MTLVFTGGVIVSRGRRQIKSAGEELGSSRILVLNELAPQVGLEPTTLRLTAEMRTNDRVDIH
jgi:hypothetical protein